MKRSVAVSCHGTKNVRCSLFAENIIILRDSDTYLVSNVCDCRLLVSPPRLSTETRRPPGYASLYAYCIVMGGGGFYITLFLLYVRSRVVLDPDTLDRFDSDSFNIVGTRPWLYNLLKHRPQSPTHANTE